MNNIIKVEIGEFTFHISIFCFCKIGNTQNMKFKLECAQDSKHDKEFDDFESLKNYLSECLWEAVDEKLF